MFQVDGVDLRDASHEQAVDAIRKAGNPVVFLVQSIITRPRVSDCAHKITHIHATHTLHQLCSHKAHLHVLSKKNIWYHTYVLAVEYMAAAAIYEAHDHVKVLTISNITVIQGT